MFEGHIRTKLLQVLEEVNSPEGLVSMICDPLGLLGKRSDISIYSNITVALQVVYF